MKYFFGFLFLLHTFPVYADAPLQAPRTVQRESLNKIFTAISDPKKGTVVLRNDGKEMWRIPAWFRDFYISNDGIHFVSTYSGLDLLPLDYKNNLVLITFWKKGKIVKKVLAGEFIPKKNNLVRTTSHYFWGTVEGINKDDVLKVQRADGVAFFYDIKTGSQVTH